MEINGKNYGENSDGELQPGADIERTLEMHGYSLKDKAMPNQKPEEDKKNLIAFNPNDSEHLKGFKRTVEKMAEEIRKPEWENFIKWINYLSPWNLWSDYPKETKLMPRVEKRLNELLSQAQSETEKAFGGCKNCYGKGYATTIEYATEGMPDFGEDDGERHTSMLPIMRFCSCGRGKQLEKYFGEAQSARTKEILEVMEDFKRMSRHDSLAVEIANRLISAIKKRFA